MRAKYADASKDISLAENMILIAAGSNLPFCGVDSQQIVLHSILAIGRVADVIARSQLYASPAWPDPADPPFVNAVVQVRTDIAPAALLAALHGVEAAFGRHRGQRNAPRTLDLDLIAYGDRQSEDPALPHPRLADRAFVLAPICDFAPAWRPPGETRSAAELLARLPDRTAKPIKPAD